MTKPILALLGSACVVAAVAACGSEDPVVVNPPPSPGTGADSEPEPAEPGPDDAPARPASRPIAPDRVPADLVALPRMLPERVRPGARVPESVSHRYWPRWSGTCGPSVCGSGEYCCNESCGICAPFGGSCTQQVCAPAD